MSSKDQFAGERVSFSSVFEEKTRDAKKVKQKEYLRDGAHPVIDQGQNLTAGYVNEEDGLFVDVPAIIFGDHTRCIKYIDEPFFAGADGVKILKPKSGHTRFWYHVLRAVQIENLGYSRHFKILKQSSFRLYDEAQQYSISNQLDLVLEQLKSAESLINAFDFLVKSRFNFREVAA